MKFNYIKIAHRGHDTHDTHNKGNKISSFMNAIISTDFDMIELDIQLCKSGEIIVYHDNHINYKYISKMSFKEIKNHDFEIITIQDFFKIPLIRTKKLYFDLKGDNFSDENNSLLIIKLIHFFKENKIKTHDIYIGSFNLNHITQLMNHKKDFQFKLGVITANCFPFDCLSHFKEKLDFICFDYTILNYNLIKKCREKNITIFCYTCNDLLLLNMLDHFKIDGIVTDIRI